jgi:hypothetical protein
MNGESRTPTPLPPVTLFMCGPSKCEHDYNRYEPIIVDGQERGETLVCSKCGRSAFEEAQWL